ncbi:8-oxoguanine DNA glycosylase [Clostridia bacterium]|nr:8-oxoguanine DNA glycosylase [Clostridia bacterium]
MKYEAAGNGVKMTEFDSFDIEHILECGQCFRFSKLGEKDYKIAAHGRVLRVTQSGGEVLFSPCSLLEFEKIWAGYFDLERDYSEIKKFLSKDEVMKKAVEFGGGIRILNQERFECILSFIISQNNQIPRIKKCIGNLCEKYGADIGGEYAFPDISILAKLSEYDFNELRVGFRAKYLADAVYRIQNNLININCDDSYGEIKRELLDTKGIGAKVSNCILLFSFGKRASFPVDVWVRRVVEHFYFPEGNNEIEKWAAEKFGEYGGYAQQYLFYYARSLKIGKS